MIRVNISIEIRPELSWDEAAACHRPDVLLEVSKCPYREVRAKAAGNCYMPLGYQVEPPPGLNVCQWRAWLGRQPLAGLVALALDDHDEVALAVAGNHWADDYILHYLEKNHANPAVREMAHVTLRNLYD